MQKSILAILLPLVLAGNMAFAAATGDAVPAVALNDSTSTDQAISVGIYNRDYSLPTSEYQMGDPLNIQVFDASANISNSKIEEISADVIVIHNGAVSDKENVRLKETFSDTGEFRNSISVAIAPRGDLKVDGDGRLEVIAGDTIEVSYKGVPASAKVKGLASIAFSPVFIGRNEEDKILAKRGESVTKQITITNQGTDVGLYITRITDMYMGDDGNLTTHSLREINPSSEEYKFLNKVSMVNWISLEAKDRRFRLAPNESRQISVTFKIPSDAAVGTHFADILFTLVDESTFNSGPNTAAKVAALPAAGPIAMITVQGDKPEDVVKTGQIAGFDIGTPSPHGIQSARAFEIQSADKYPFLFQIRYQNTGNAFYVPHGKIAIKGLLGLTKFEIPFFQRYSSDTDQNIGRVTSMPVKHPISWPYRTNTYYQKTEKNNFPNLMLPSTMFWGNYDAVLTLSDGQGNTSTAIIKNIAINSSAGQTAKSVAGAILALTMAGLFGYALYLIWRGR